MKKYSYVGVSFIILVFGILFVPKIARRLQGVEQRVQNSRLSSQEGASKALAYVMRDGVARRVPDFAFRDQDSLLVTPHDFSGMVYLVEFFFVNCPTICPKMNANLKYIVDTLGDQGPLGVASITINPEMDTSRVLKKYAEGQNIKYSDWHFLTGDREVIYELARDGFSLYASENEEQAGGFEHSGYFALVDQQGYLRSRIDALGNPIVFYRGTIGFQESMNDVGESEQISMLIQDIEQLWNENPRP